MFLRCYPRHKDGKTHRYWSLVETAGCAAGAWCSARCSTWGRSMTANATLGARHRGVRGRRGAGAHLAPFPEDRGLRSPMRQWSRSASGTSRCGAPGSGGVLAGVSAVRATGAGRLLGCPTGREPQRHALDLILQALTAYRLIDPAASGGSTAVVRRECAARPARRGSSWPRSINSIGAWTACSRTSAPSLPTCRPLQDLFNARYDVLLYDLTSTYFESDPPADPTTSGASATAGTNGATACRSCGAVITPRASAAYEVLSGT